MAGDRLQRSAAERGRAAVYIKPLAPADDCKRRLVFVRRPDDEVKRQGRFAPMVAVLCIAITLLDVDSLQACIGFYSFVRSLTADASWLCTGTMTLRGLRRFGNTVVILLGAIWIVLHVPSRLGKDLLRQSAFSIAVAALALGFSRISTSSSAVSMMLTTIEVAVGILITSCAVDMLRWMDDCIQKVLSLGPPTVIHHADQREAISHELEDEIQKLQVEVQHLKAVADRARQGSILCKICYEQDVSCALEPCRHHAFCLSCSERLISLKQICPLCRQPVTGLIQTFLA